MMCVVSDLSRAVLSRGAKAAIKGREYENKYEMTSLRAYQTSCLPSLVILQVRFIIAMSGAGIQCMSRVFSLPRLGGVQQCGPTDEKIARVKGRG